MPLAPPKPCRSPGCGKLVFDGAGYCAKHKRPSSNWAAPERGSSHSRGYGWQWQKLRKTILERDQGLCLACLKVGRISAANHVDHVTPKCRGGLDTPDNLQSLCGECHKVKTSAESNG